jgi:hypothetical protein
LALGSAALLLCHHLRRVENVCHSNDLHPSGGFAF